MVRGRIEVRRIKVVDDGGNEFTIIEIQPTHYERAADGSLINLSPKIPIFELTDGEPVNGNTDGTYKIMRTGQVLRTV